MAVTAGALRRQRPNPVRGLLRPRPPVADGGQGIAEQECGRCWSRVCLARTNRYDVPLVQSSVSLIGPGGCLDQRKGGAMSRRWLVVASLAAMTVAVATSSAWAAPIAGHFKEFPIPTANSEPRRIAAGPDGALWFTEFRASQIGRITTAGAITEFPVAGSTFPFDIAGGPDGRMWFTESESLIGAIDPATGRIRQFTLPGTDVDATGITGGPDGAVWFTVAPGLGGSGDAIGRITPRGKITEFPLPSGSSPSDITTGPDGALWFTEPGNAVIGRITTTGQLTTFTGADLNGEITTGPDGNLWFTTGFDQNIGRITPDGQVTLFPLPQPGTPDDIVTGADGNLWFTEFAANRIGKITTDGVITQTKPKDSIEPEGIASGPDGNIWFTEFHADTIGELILPKSDPSA